LRPINGQESAASWRAVERLLSGGVALT